MTQPNGISDTWTVTSQTETSAIPPGGGQFQSGMKITFTTGHGVTGSVFIPYANYGNTAYVRQTIADRVAQLDAVSVLSSGATS